jgi:ABC-type nitrate/sulfonate/bicarbonate transport system permease component
MSRRAIRDTGQRLVLGLIGIAAIVGVWYLVSAQLQPVQLPSPTVVWNTLWTDLHNIAGLSYVSYGSQSLLGALGWTAANVAICCGIGCVAGYGLGLLIATSRVARQALTPPLFMLGTVPTLVVLPFVLIWFGPSRLAQGSLVIVFTALTVSAFTEQAAARVGSDFRNYARSLGAGHRMLVREVIVPASLPGVAAGLRVSLATGWSLEAVAELIAGQNGIGRIIQSMAQLDRTADVIAAVLLLSAVAVAADLILVLATKGMTPWMER